MAVVNMMLRRKYGYLFIVLRYSNSVTSFIDNNKQHNHAISVAVADRIQTVHNQIAVAGRIQTSQEYKNEIKEIIVAGRCETDSN